MKSRHKKEYNQHKADRCYIPPTTGAKTGAGLLFILHKKRKKKSRRHKPPTYLFRTAERTPWNPGKKHDSYIIPSKAEKTREKRPEPKLRSLTFNRILRQRDKLRAF